MHLLVLQTHIFPVSCRIALACDSCNKVFDNAAAVCSKWGLLWEPGTLSESPNFRAERETEEHNL